MTNPSFPPSAPRPVPHTLHINTHSLGIRLNTSPPDEDVSTLPPLHPHMQQELHQSLPHPTPPSSVAASPHNGAVSTSSLTTAFSQHHIDHLPSMSSSSCSSGTSTSSSSSSESSPSLVQQDDDITPTSPQPPQRYPRRRSILTRKSSGNGTGSGVTSPVTCQSWDHLSSPAASFLAGFASPLTAPSSSQLLEEQAGDEIDDYVMNDIVGYGGSSTVRKGYCISNGQHVAIKIVKKSHQEDLDRELSIWSSLEHQHIVQLHKVLDTEHATYVVCDYCPETLLCRLQHQAHTMSEQEKKRMFSQLVSAVHYLHEQCHVVHKDIKLDNVLLDQHNNVKLCDFGLAVHQQPTLVPPHLQVSDPGLAEDGSSVRQSKDPHASACIPGSLAYCAPEQLKANCELTCPKTDVWSLGVVLYAMFAGRLPFDDEYDVRLRQSILEADYTMPASFPSPVADLIQNCLILDPDQRFSLSQIKDHTWFA